MSDFQERLQDLMNEKNLSRLSKQFNMSASAIDDYFNKNLKSYNQTNFILYY